jgi:hypothetical protein
VIGNLLINLQKYRPREYTNPMENFFSEILAYILNNEKELLSKFCNLFGYSGDVDNFRVITQKPYEGMYVDIEIYNNYFSFIIENKLGSSVNESVEENSEGERIVNNQLLNYISIQEKKEKSDKDFKGYVILLTEYYERISQNISNYKSFKILYWDNVYLLIKSYKDKSKNAIINNLIDEFVELMEHVNMEPFKKINKETIENCRYLLLNIKKLFGFINRELKLEDLSNKSCELRMSSGNRDLAGDINFIFHINDTECKVNFDIDDMKFYLRVRGNGLSKEKKEKLELKSFYVEDNYLIKGYPMPDEFFSYDDKKQQEIIKNFYQENIQNVKSIL